MVKSSCFCLHGSTKNWNQKLFFATQELAEGHTTTKTAREKPHNRATQTPGLHVSDSDTVLHEGFLTGRNTLEVESEEIIFNVSIATEPSQRGFHKFSCSLEPSIDIPCRHVVAFLQRVATRLSLPLCHLWEKDHPKPFY